MVRQQPSSGSSRHDQHPLTWPFFSSLVFCLTASPMQSSALSTVVPKSSDRRGTIGVNLHHRSGSIQSGLPD